MFTASLNVDCLVTQLKVSTVGSNFIYDLHDLDICRHIATNITGFRLNNNDIGKKKKDSLYIGMRMLIY